MTCYKENFGEDIDGNRGRSMWFYDLDDDDTNDILDYIEESQPDIFDMTHDEMPKTITVTLFSRYTDEFVDFEIDPRKYIKEWNQRAMLLNHLKKAPITKLEALNLYGIWNSGNMIFNLRNAGHNIITTMKNDGKKRYAVYSLKLK